jgi:hypothetical protein
MTDKPSYLGLLNSIANAEAQAECYLDAWAACCPRDDVRQVIATVALREGEHGKAFAKRICELGFALQQRSDGKLEERMSIASSTTLTDREKFEKLDLGREADPSRPDVFARMFEDQTIDIQTGALLGRYIAEERDSGRMLRACYQALCAEENGNSRAGASSNGAGGDRLARIETLLEQVLTRLPA